MDSRNSLASSEEICTEDMIKGDGNHEISTDSVENISSSVSSSNGEIHFELECLPHVVILTILSYLNLKDLGRIGSVSKYMNSCFRYPGLWFRVDVSNRKQVNDLVFQRIMDNGKNITVLNISETVNISEYGLCAGLQECKTLLQFIAVRCYNVTDACLDVIARNSVNLQSTDLSMCKITDKGIGQLCQGCTKLEQIKLNYCIQLTSQTLLHIANNCHKLKFLSVENNSKMHDDGVEELVSKCSELKRLQLNSCGITGHSIHNIAAYSHAMTVLDVRYCTTLDDDLVQNLVCSCANLVILNLSLCFKVTDVSVLHICQYCTQLKSIYLVHCRITDEGLKTISLSSLGLEWIDVSWCQDITDVGVRALLHGCTTLAHLGIVRCDLVTNETIHELCLRYPSVYISSFITEMDRFFKKADSNSEGNPNQIQPQ